MIYGGCQSLKKNSLTRELVPHDIWMESKKRNTLSSFIPLKHKNVVHLVVPSELAHDRIFPAPCQAWLFAK